MLTEKEIEECKKILAHRAAHQAAAVQVERLRKMEEEAKSARMAEYTRLLQSAADRHPGKKTPVMEPVQQGPVVGKNATVESLRTSVWV